MLEITVIETVFTANSGLSQLGVSPMTLALALLFTVNLYRQLQREQTE